MTIIDIYEAAKARGLARSLRQFSTDFLGMAPNYAADTGLARCSADAMLRLYHRLGELRQPDLQARAFNCLLVADEGHGDARAVRR